MKKNIFVTGSHRSGSTWVGYVISKAQKVRYVHEPFNIGLTNKNSPLHFWFEYVAGTSKKHQQKVRHYLHSFYYVFHLHNIRRFFRVRSFKDIYLYFADLKGRCTDRSIIKDPLAIMSAEWMYENYGCDMVVLIRHPAAFVASLKVKNWQYDFNQFRLQEGLMNTWLKGYSAEISEYATNQKDIIDQGILLWNTIHNVIAGYRKKYENEWYFVRHEDISKDPIPEFEKIFYRLNLTLDDFVRNYIIDSSTAKRKAVMNRDTTENIRMWKQRLTPLEIERIKNGTQKVWPNFYSEEDW